MIYSDNIKNIKVGLFKRIIAFIIILVGFELILFKEDYILWIGLGQGILLLLFNLWVVRFKLKNPETYNKLIIPMLFYMGSLAFLILIPSQIFAHIYILIISFLYTYIVKNIRNVKRYSDNKELFNMNDIYLLITAFLICSGIFGIYIFLYLPMWLLLSLSLVLIDGIVNSR